jgi:hypothetical protein
VGRTALAGDGDEVENGRKTGDYAVEVKIGKRGLFGSGGRT